MNGEPVGQDAPESPERVKRALEMIGAAPETVKNLLRSAWLPGGRLQRVRKLTDPTITPAEVDLISKEFVRAQCIAQRLQLEGTLDPTMPPVSEGGQAPPDVVAELRQRLDNLKPHQREWVRLRHAEVPQSLTLVNHETNRRVGIGLCLVGAAEVFDIDPLSEPPYDVVGAALDLVGAPPADKLGLRFATLTLDQCSKFAKMLDAMGLTLHLHFDDDGKPHFVGPLAAQSQPG